VSERRRIAVFCVAAALLGAGGALLAFAGGEEDALAPASTTAGAGVQELDKGAPGEQLIAQLQSETREELERAEHAARRQELVELKEHEAEPETREAERLAFASERASAQLAARRFFSAFARYELGELTPRIERELQVTSTIALARQLLAASPRVSTGAGAPSRARLRGLEFVPRRLRGGELVSLELVGTVDRGGAKTPVAIAIRRAGGDRWLVDALGR